MRRKSLFKRVLSLISALFLLTNSVAFGFFEEVPAPRPQITINSPFSEISTHKSRLFATSGSFADLAPIYDGDETTAGGGERELTLTIDFAEYHNIAGVKFLPADTDIGWPNRIIGTKFYLSADGVNFIPVASIEPMAEDMSAVWQEIFFDGVGSYRYAKIELPAGAYFSEVKWLEYTSWEYSGNKELAFDLAFSNVPADTEAMIMAGVFSNLGILKNLSFSEITIKDGDIIPLNFSIPRGKIGDIVKVFVIDKNGYHLTEAPFIKRLGDCGESLKMPNIFSDNMLFQRDMPLTIYGSAPSRSVVTAQLKNSDGDMTSRNTVADRNGKWSINLGSFGGGGNYTLSVIQGTDIIRYHNITFGDLWLLTGQSNMDYFMEGGDDTIADLKDFGEPTPDIRIVNLWNLGLGGAGAPTENIPLAYGKSAWEVLTPDSARYFSAIGYYFSKNINKEYNIPIGILSVAVGDTEINRWLPRGKRFGSFTATDGNLYNNRIAPLKNLKIRGILMYQGEADQYRTHLSTIQYRDAMSGMVDLYRQFWGYDTPFYWAQLTRYEKKDESIIRDAQRLAERRVKNQRNIGVISLIDIYGEFEDVAGNCREDIHPHQKDVVAERFLLFAKRDVYGEEVTPHGPVYQGMRINGDEIILNFSATGELSVLSPEKYADKKGMEFIEKEKIDITAPLGFEIAGADRVFVPAEAEIQGTKIILKSPDIPEPKMARYAFGAYPETPNLTDDTGLPALTFSTHIIED